MYTSKQVFIKFLFITIFSLAIYLDAESQTYTQVLSAPTSSTTCTPGQVCSINWYVTDWNPYNGGTEKIIIEYQVSGASSWTTIIETTSTDQGYDSYNWTVPSGLAHGTYQIRIGQWFNYITSGYNSWGYSDLFQVADAPYINILQPGTGSTYYIGDKVLFDWETNDAPVSFFLERFVTSEETSILLNPSNEWDVHQGMEPGLYFLYAQSATVSEYGGSFYIKEPKDGVYSLNYTRSKTARIPEDDVSSFDILSANQGSITDGITYFDGLGRIRQSISLYSTPAGNHMVSSFSYNELGLQATSYLSYPTSSGVNNFKEKSIEAQANYYNNPGAGVTSNSHPYSVTIFENSPLLTVEEQGAPGADWQPGEHSIKSETRLNLTADQVIEWNIETLGDERSSGDPTGVGYYPDGELSVTVTTDEDDNISEVYIDREGREVLKIGYQGANQTLPVKTYYVYDTFGNLRFIIPPKAVDEIGTSPVFPIDLDPFNTIRTNWLTEIKYDGYNRVIEKKIPEAEWVYTVYDKLGRVAFTQDGNMRTWNGSAWTKNDWFFTKYDIRGRTILTGVYSEIDPAKQSRQGMQNHMDSLATYWESRTNTNFSTQHGYTLNIFPSDLAYTEYWSVNWYDNYDFDSDGTPDETFNPHADFLNPTGNNLVAHEADLSRTDGQLTGSLTLVLDRMVLNGDGQEFTSLPAGEETVYIKGDNIVLKPGFSTAGNQSVVIGSSIAIPTKTFLKGVAFYDKYGSTIYSKSDNHVGGQDESWTLYKFDGLVAETRLKHTSSSENLEIENRFEYDSNGRLVSEYHNDQKISGLTYNELGQLRSKSLSNDPSQVNGVIPWSQTLNYTYHERGWLKSVNDPASLGSDLFAYKLSYEGSNSGGQSSVLYNGTITNIEWADSQTGRHQYSYSYDKLGQLTQAQYRLYNSSWSTGDEYGTSHSYDVNGNMATLLRKSAGSTIDNLQYYYTGVGNRVSRIDDNQNNTSGFYDNGSTQATEYTYDDNGSMITDSNKEIASVTYNYLNLPTRIIFSSDDPAISGNQIVFTYDAGGSKLTKTTYPAGNAGVTTDYSGGFVYDDNALGFYTFSEGRVRKVSGSFQYEYDLTDHLGNIRATFKPYIFNSASVLQMDSYYPFGLKMTGLSYVGSGAVENKFTYNGNELEDEFSLDWYHYGARYYDPAVGMWWAVDPVDEHISPYNYVSNNPINYTDPTGMFKWKWMANVYAWHKGGGNVELATDRNEWYVGQHLSYGDIEAGHLLVSYKRTFNGNWLDVRDFAGGVVNGATFGRANAWFGWDSQYDAHSGFAKVGEFTGGAITSSSIASTISYYRNTTVFYRSMGDEAAEIFVKTGRMPAGTETFISPTKSFAQKYSGQLFKIRVNNSAISQLKGIGVRNAAQNHPYKYMPLVSKGWKSKNAFFKLESSQINIGLGNGRALDIFNKNIRNFRQYK